MELRAVFVEDRALVEGSNLLGSLRANVVSGMVKCDHAEGAAQLPFCSSTETRTSQASPRETRLHLSKEGGQTTSIICSSESSGAQSRSTSLAGVFCCARGKGFGPPNRAAGTSRTPVIVRGVTRGWHVTDTSDSTGRQIVIVLMTPLVDDPDPPETWCKLLV